MRSRTVREGSVGLLILLGLGLFVGIALWLRGISPGKRSYTAVVEFANVSGLQQGAAVRYRGVTVGSVSDIRPAANGVEVEVEFTPADWIIPRNVIVEANQSGFLSEVNLDIRPLKQLPPGTVVAKPLENNCDRTLIICNGSRLQGQIGISFDELIRSSTRFASTYSDPALTANINAAAKNASVAAASATQLTRELSSLTKATQKQLGNFSATAGSVQQAANQIGTSTNKATNQLGATAEQIRLTSVQANRLIANLDTLVTANRSSLVTALNNISRTSDVLRSTINDLAPIVNRVNQGELIQNLETLSANAAQASANLRNASNALNDPTNALVLQQTLDSARVTFQNAQKITSDLDELTGDPQFRQNLRELVNGLSSLVSSTDQIQQQVQLAQTLDSVTAAVKNSQAGTSSLGASNESMLVVPTVDSSAFSLDAESLQPNKIAQPDTAEPTSTAEPE